MSSASKQTKGNDMLSKASDDDDDDEDFKLADRPYFFNPLAVVK